MAIDEKMLFLGDLIHFANFYDILDIASHKIGQAFLEVEGLDKLYHNHADFFLGVGYYLQSEIIFVEALKYATREIKLEPDEDNGTLPDNVLELKLQIRQRFSRKMGERIHAISGVLAFREHQELSYDNFKHQHSLTERQLKIRELAKTTVMNWVTRNILQILDLGEIYHLPAWNWHQFVAAVREEDVSHLRGISIQRLARRYEIRPATLGSAIKEQLHRLQKTGSPEPLSLAFPCKLRDVPLPARRLHHTARLWHRFQHAS